MSDAEPMSDDLKSDEEVQLKSGDQDQVQLTSEDRDRDQVRDQDRDQDRDVDHFRDRDSNPVQPLNDALSLRETEVELDYEAEEDDQDVSKEVEKAEPEIKVICNKNSIA